MSLLAIIPSIFGAISSATSGFFSVGEKKIELMGTLVKTVGDANTSASDRETAIAAVIAAEAGSSSRLAATWRPMLMVIFACILVSFWFGYAPANIEGEMPPMIAEIFFLIKLGIGGYIPARTIEKIVNQLSVSKVIQKLLEKRGLI